MQLLAGIFQPGIQTILFITICHLTHGAGVLGVPMLTWNHKKVELTWSPT